jgi:prepilin-type N-terminal cleavage/methylation domain-containing protein
MHWTRPPLLRHAIAPGARREGRVPAAGGFTLIELMVVIVILAVLSSMIIPAMGGSMGRMRAETAARMIADLADHCYRQAVTTGRVHALVISADGRELAVLAEPPVDPATPLWGVPLDADGNPVEPALQPVGIPGWMDRMLPEGVMVSEATLFDTEAAQTVEGDAQLLFFPDGTAEFGVVSVSSLEGDVYDVTIEGMSGTVRVGLPEATETTALGEAPEMGGETVAGEAPAQ